MTESRVRMALAELGLACAARGRLIAARAGDLALYAMACVLVPVKRAYARIEGASLEEAVRSYPRTEKPQWLIGAATPPPATALAADASPAQPALMANENSGTRYVPPPKRTIPVNEQVLPPNIERALASQLAASHKDKLANDDVQRYLTAFGIVRGDATFIVSELERTHARAYVTADDLAELQRLVDKRWITARKRDRALFDRRVREQLELSAIGPIDTAEVTAILERRGYRPEAAARLATLLSKSPPGSLH